MDFDDQLVVVRIDLHRNGSVHVFEAIVCVVMVVVIELS
jgi:hypothetical protein